MVGMGIPVDETGLLDDNAASVTARETRDWRGLSWCVEKDRTGRANRAERKPCNLKSWNHCSTSSQLEVRAADRKIAVAINLHLLVWNNWKIDC